MVFDFERFFDIVEGVLLIDLLEQLVILVLHDVQRVLELRLVFILLDKLVLAAEGPEVPNEVLEGKLGIHEVVFFLDILELLFEAIPRVRFGQGSEVAERQENLFVPFLVNLVRKLVVLVLVLPQQPQVQLDGLSHVPEHRQAPVFLQKLRPNQLQERRYVEPVQRLSDRNQVVLHRKPSLLQRLV